VILILHTYITYIRCVFLLLLGGIALTAHSISPAFNHFYVAWSVFLVVTLVILA